MNHEFLARGDCSHLGKWLNLRHLFHPGSPSRPLRNIWLEHDVRISSIPARQQIPLDRKYTPSIFFGPLLSGVRCRTSDLYACCNYHFANLFGFELPDAFEFIMQNSLDGGLQVMQVGYMCSRTPPSIRIVLKSHCIRRTAQFLSSMSSFSLPSLPEVLHGLLAHGSAHAIGLECSLQGALSCKYGLEFYAGWQDPSDWNPLIDKFLDLSMDLCVPPSLLRGLAAIKLSLKKSVSIPSQLVGSGHSEYLSLEAYVGLHHLKLSVQEGCAISSPKAYIGVLTPQFTSVDGTLVLAENFPGLVPPRI
jgi:hypothetical protein